MEHYAGRFQCEEQNLTHVYFFEYETLGADVHPKKFKKIIQTVSIIQHRITILYYHRRPTLSRKGGRVQFRNFNCVTVHQRMVVSTVHTCQALACISQNKRIKK